MITMNVSYIPYTATTRINWCQIQQRNQPK